MAGTPKPTTVSTKLQRIAKLAKDMPGVALNTLAHHIDIDWMREAYRRTRKDGAVGVDGQTAQEYAAHLEENLQALLTRAKTGTYRAPPVLRAEIPKTGKTDETRPIGIPTFEDKVLQRAVSMVLGAVYEQDFLDCSWGFRPGRSAHGALEGLWKQLMDMGGAVVVEIDIRRFFDELDQARLRDILRQRVRDGVLLRLIGKWLKAGVMTDGQLTYPHTGTPQGGVVSPILSNVYLHEALDVWFEHEIKPQLKGKAGLVRYADDAILVFEHAQDAERVYAALPRRFAAYGLRLHPEKTRMVEFSRPNKRGPRGSASGSGSFDLLGFTHFWARSRKGNWVVKRKTAKDRFSRSVKAANDWCRHNRHLPIAEQHRTLTRKLRGTYNYYGITGNSPALGRFRHAVLRIWRKWLNRRSQRARLHWDRFNRLLERYPLPPARAVHSICRRAANH